MEKTLKDLVIATRCRRGTAAGTTKQGAYWLALPPILIREYGSDGIGNNAADMEHYLELRHFRNGEVRAAIHKTGWHENGARGGACSQYFPADLVLDCLSIEEVIVSLKGMECKDTATYGDKCNGNLVGALQPIGLPISLPAPDDFQSLGQPALVTLKGVAQ